MKTTPTAHYEEAHADATPSNWGHAGDMQHVRARLADVLAFLQGAA